MFTLLIFGGTTEGRELAEFCTEKSVITDVSVATEYGASLLPNGVNVLCGRLDAKQMTQLIRRGYSAVIDATHPYAVEATENIRRACNEAKARYLRLIRGSSSDCGSKTVSCMTELIQLLNNTDATILSTLGSKSLRDLSNIRRFRERLWVRVLPSEEIYEQCRLLGYDLSKVIQEKGPFTVEQNVAHLRKSGASIILTKESGETGGYPEKAEAARLYGAEMITLARPVESGYSFKEIIEIIEKELKK